MGYSLLDTLFNGSLQNYDIIKKIELTKVHYGQNLPNHIKVYINHIEGMELYSELKNMSQSITTIEDVKIKYLAFLEKYFDHENQFELTGK